MPHERPDKRHLRRLNHPGHRLFVCATGFDFERGGDMTDRLTKAETVALWHAVSWMEECVRQVTDHKVDPLGIETERERLKTAKRALRKVNAIRKEQAIEAKAVTGVRS